MTDLSTRLHTVTGRILALAASMGVQPPSSPDPPPVVVEPPPLPSDPTQPPTDGGDGTGLSPLRLLGDDFSQYADSAAFLANVTRDHGGTGNPATVLYNDCHAPAMATIDDTVRYNGHHTLKYNQPAGTDATPQLWPSLPHTVTRLWFRVKVRWSPGFTTTGVTPNYGTGYKFLGWGWGGGNDGRGSLEFENVSQYYFRWTIVPRNTALASSGTKEGPGGSVSKEWSDGQWYDYIILVEQTNGGASMRQRFWLAKDGSTPVLRADQSGTMASGQKAPPIDRIMLGMNFNQQRAPEQHQALWIGQWQVVDASQYRDPFGVLG